MIFQEECYIFLLFPGYLGCTNSSQPLEGASFPLLISLSFQFTFVLIQKCLCRFIQVFCVWFRKYSKAVTLCIFSTPERREWKKRQSASLSESAQPAFHRMILEWKVKSPICFVKHITKIYIFFNKLLTLRKLLFCRVLILQLKTTKRF